MPREPSIGTKEREAITPSIITGMNNRITVQEAWSRKHEENCERRHRIIDEKFQTLGTKVDILTTKVDLIYDAVVKPAIKTGLGLSLQQRVSRRPYLYSIGGISIVYGAVELMTEVNLFLVAFKSFM